MPDAKPRRLVQRFFLEGDVEVSIKFPPGAARWQSTQSAVSIATGEGDALPQIGQPLASAGVSVPAAPPAPIAPRRRPMSSADLFGEDGAAELELGLMGSVDA